nr:helix-turn-helix domain-containing protein [uncultured Christensenella sp.]
MKGAYISKTRITQEPTESKTYSVQDIAKILNIGMNTAYVLVKQGDFRVLRIGSAIRIVKSSFDEWLKQSS